MCKDCEMPNAYEDVDITSMIIDYEYGLLDQDDTIMLFQKLIDTGVAWQLQGSYGRTAAALIEAGYCHQ
jgi:hypothetical protein